MLSQNSVPKSRRQTYAELDEVVDDIEQEESPWAGFCKCCGNCFCIFVPDEDDGEEFMANGITVRRHAMSFALISLQLMFRVLYAEHFFLQKIPPSEWTFYRLECRLFFANRSTIDRRQKIGRLRKTLPPTQPNLALCQIIRLHCKRYFFLGDRSMHANVAHAYACTPMQQRDQREEEAVLYYCISSSSALINNCNSSAYKHSLSHAYIHIGADVISASPVYALAIHPCVERPLDAKSPPVCGPLSISHCVEPECNRHRSS